MTAGPATSIECGNGIAASAEIAHVAGIAQDAAGRTILLVTLSGGEVLAREALAARMVAAMGTAAAPAPAVNQLAAVFARLSQPPAPVPSAATPVVKKFVPAIVLEPAPVAPSPYEAPFVLAPLHRPAG